MKLLKNYKSSIILFVSVLIGGAIGIISPTIAEYLRPIGDLFLNFMYVVIVPLVFLSILSSITTVSQASRLKKIISRALIIFVITAFIAASFAFVMSLAYNPTKGVNVEEVLASIEGTEFQVDENALSVEDSIGDSIVKMLSVNDFLKLFTKSNLLQLIIFSFIVGIAINMTGEKAEPLKKLIHSASQTMATVVSLIMKAAPIGLGCYFASTISSLGSSILVGFLRVLILYLIFSVIYYFVFFSIYALLAGGKEGLSRFWKNSVEPSLTAIATASSAACIPVNIISAKSIGVSNDIAESVIPLGVNVHKDGSVAGGVFKLVFIFGLYERIYSDISAAAVIIFVALLAGIVIGAIPSGGLTGEILMVSLFGFPEEMIAVIAVISLLIDIPATLLNSSGNIVCAMLVQRMVEGKNWLKNKALT